MIFLSILFRPVPEYDAPLPRFCWAIRSRGTSRITLLSIASFLSGSNADAGNCKGLAESTWHVPYISYQCSVQLGERVPSNADAAPHCAQCLATLIHFTEPGLLVCDSKDRRAGSSCIITIMTCGPAPDEGAARRNLMEAWMSVRLESVCWLGCSRCVLARGRIRSIVLRRRLSVRCAFPASPELAVPRIMGLSHEWGNTMSMFGYSKTGANMVYRQLIAKNLTASDSDRRTAHWRQQYRHDRQASRRPDEALRRIVERLALALHPGRESRSGDLALSESQVDFYLKEMPKGAIEAIEIGNEPDHYPKRKMRPSRMA